MTILSKPWRIDRRGERIYIDAPGEVCVDLCSGTQEDRARVMALLEQVQRMANLLVDHLAGRNGHNCPTTAPECSICGPIEECLRAAGVLDE